MSIIAELLRALLSETEASNAGIPKGQTMPLATYARARGASRQQKSPPPAPMATDFLSPEESRMSLFPDPPMAGVRRSSSVSINIGQAQQGVVWAEVLSRPRAMKPWSPRT